MALCSHRFLWYYIEPMSSINIDELLLQLTADVFDKYADYVIRDLSFEGVFQPQRNPTSFYHSQRVTVFHK